MMKAFEQNPPKPVEFICEINAQELYMLFYPSGGAFMLLQ